MPDLRARKKKNVEAGKSGLVNPYMYPNEKYKKGL